jgi:hypothetical protein
MAGQPAPPPQMQISIRTAIKAGFFGAIGFFVAQLVIVPLVLLLMVLLGVAASKAAAPSDTPARHFNK